jgi:hypothetical protein
MGYLLSLAGLDLPTPMRGRFRQLLSASSVLGLGGPTQSLRKQPNELARSMASWAS